MSRESIIKFYEEVRKKEKLKKEFEALKNQVEKEKETKEESIAKKITVLAKKNGFDFTEKELLSYMEEVKNTLTEEELLDVSGGRMSAKAAGLGLMGTLMLSFATGAAFNLVGSNIGNTPMQQQEVVLDNEEKPTVEETEEEKSPEGMEITGATTKRATDFGKMFRGGSAPSGRSVTSKSKLGNLDLKGKTPTLETKKDEGKTVNVAENKATPAEATVHAETPKATEEEEATVEAAAPEVDEGALKAAKDKVTAAQTELSTAEGKLKNAQENHKKAVAKKDEALKDTVVKYYDAIESVSNNWFGSEWDLTVTMKKGQTAPEKDKQGWNQFLLAVKAKLNKSNFKFDILKSVKINGKMVAEYAGENRANPGEISADTLKKIDDFEKEILPEIKKAENEVKNQQAQVDKAKKNKEAAEAAVKKEEARLAEAKKKAEAAKKAEVEKKAEAEKAAKEKAEAAKKAEKEAKDALEKAKAERVKLENQRKTAEESKIVQYYNDIERVDYNSSVWALATTSEWDLNVIMKDGKTAPEAGTAQWDQFLLAARAKLNKSNFTFGKLRTVSVNGELKAQYDDADNGRPNIIENNKTREYKGVLEALTTAGKAESEAQAAAKKASIAAERADTRFSEGWKKLSGIVSKGQAVASNDQTSYISEYAVDENAKEIVLKIDKTAKEGQQMVDIDDVVRAMERNGTLKNYKGYKITLSQDSSVVMSDYMLMKIKEGAATTAFRVAGDTVYLKCEIDEQLLKDTGAKDTEALVSSLIAQWNAQHKGKEVKAESIPRIMIVTPDGEILHYKKEGATFVNLQEAANAILEFQIATAKLEGTKVVVTVKDAYKDKTIAINEAFLKALDMKLGGGKIDFTKLDNIEFTNAKVGTSTEGGTVKDSTITFNDAEKEALGKKTLYLNEIAKGSLAWKITKGVAAGTITTGGTGAAAYGVYKVASYFGALEKLASFFESTGGTGGTLLTLPWWASYAPYAPYAIGAVAAILIGYLGYQGYQYLFGSTEAAAPEVISFHAEFKDGVVTITSPAGVKFDSVKQDKNEIMKSALFNADFDLNEIKRGFSVKYVGIDGIDEGIIKMFNEQEAAAIVTELEAPRSIIRSIDNYTYSYDEKTNTLTMSNPKADLGRIRLTNMAAIIIANNLVEQFRKDDFKLVINGENINLAEIKKDILDNIEDISTDEDSILMRAAIARSKTFKGVAVALKDKESKGVAVALKDKESKAVAIENLNKNFVYSFATMGEDADAYGQLRITLKSGKAPKIEDIAMMIIVEGVVPAFYEADDFEVFVNDQKSDILSKAGNIEIVEAFDAANKRLEKGPVAAPAPEGGGEAVVEVATPEGKGDVEEEKVPVGVTISSKGPAAMAAAEEEKTEETYGIKWEGTKWFGGVFSGGQVYNISFTEDGEVMTKEDVEENILEIYEQHKEEIEGNKINNIICANHETMTLAEFKQAVVNASRGHYQLKADGTLEFQQVAYIDIAKIEATEEKGGWLKVNAKNVAEGGLIAKQVLHFADNHPNAKYIYFTDGQDHFSDEAKALGRFTKNRGMFRTGNVLELNRQKVKETLEVKVVEVAKPVVVESKPIVVTKDGEVSKKNIIFYDNANELQYDKLSYALEDGVLVIKDNDVELVFDFSNQKNVESLCELLEGNEKIPDEVVVKSTNGETTEESEVKINRITKEAIPVEKVDDGEAPAPGGAGGGAGGAGSSAGGGGGTLVSPETEKICADLTKLNADFEVKAGEDGVYQILIDRKPIKVDMGYYINVIRAYQKLKKEPKLGEKFESYDVDNREKDIYTIDESYIYAYNLLTLKEKGQGEYTEAYGEKSPTVSVAGQPGSVTITGYTMTSTEKDTATVTFKVNCPENYNLEDETFVNNAKKTLSEKFTTGFTSIRFGKNVTFKFVRNEGAPAPTKVSGGGPIVSTVDLVDQKEEGKNIIFYTAGDEVGYSIDDLDCLIENTNELTVKLGSEYGDVKLALNFSDQRNVKAIFDLLDIKASQGVQIPDKLTVNSLEESGNGKILVEYVLNRKDRSIEKVDYEEDDSDVLAPTGGTGAGADAGGGTVVTPTAPAPAPTKDGDAVTVAPAPAPTKDRTTSPPLPGGGMNPVQAKVYRTFKNKSLTVDRKRVYITAKIEDGKLTKIDFKNLNQANKVKGNWASFVAAIAGDAELKTAYDFATNISVNATREAVGLNQEDDAGKFVFA